MATSNLSLLFIDRPFDDRHYNALFFWDAAVLYDSVNNITRLRVRRTEAIVSLERALVGARIVFRPCLDSGVGDSIDYEIRELAPGEIIQLFSEKMTVIDSRRESRLVKH